MVGGEGVRGLQRGPGEGAWKLTQALADPEQA